MILKLIGIAAIVVFVLVVVLFFIVRHKWKKFVNSIDDIDLPPSEIHLIEDINPDWIDASAVKEVESKGFTLGKAYTVPEMPNVQFVAFFHPSSKISGVYYSHEKAGNWYDLVAGTIDKEITVSNAPSGGEMNHPPEKQNVWRPGASFNDLYDEILCLTKDFEIVKEITPENFREEFENEYKRTMAWRNSQGGVTEDEIRRVAENTDGDLKDETIRNALKEIKRKELRRWHREIMDKFRRSDAFKEKYEDQYFYVSDQIEITVFLEYLEDYINLTQKQVNDFNSLIDETMRVSELFDNIVERMSPAIRPTFVQAINEPVKGAIYISNL